MKNVNNGTRLIMVSVCWMMLAVWPFQGRSLAAPAEDPKPDSRCAVCGMFVAKYPNWTAQIRHANGKIQWFDGTKDMLAYYFHPEQFGSALSSAMEEIWVKDYYSLEWLDGRQALYVSGSDVHGPMGHELIPFGSREAAEAFRKDHHGEKVRTFAEITPADVEALRSGRMMK